jgi:hypothetical protein
MNHTFGLVDVVLVEGLEDQAVGDDRVDDRVGLLGLQRDIAVEERIRPPSG